MVEGIGQQPDEDDEAFLMRADEAYQLLSQLAQAPEASDAVGTGPPSESKQS